ncbi:DExH-box splicing factor binding site-domain-containing protein [Boletus edulis BED1]|uniref:DExH-box splicing factor binding site-domain-containing protein n=1 Tax=Boletus edulis BED1 TaxID=1328754 RepID=A0AAD4GBR0_BOLED|nr:DExH-box splicing factor binding site-domain-containing protein [Boletus edulis BED1]
MWRECEGRYVGDELDSWWLVADKVAALDMPPTPSTVSFTVRRPTPVSRPSSSGPESDGPFKIPALPRHLASAGSSATGSPLAGSPRTFSREDSDDDGETGIVFANRFGADDASHNVDSSDEEDLIASGQRFPRKNTKAPAQEGPLVIPTRPNPDWREAAKRRRAGCSRVQRHTSHATPAFIPDSALPATGADGSVGGLGTRGTINSGPQLSGLQIKKRVKLEDGAAIMEVESAVSVDRSAAEVVEETEDQKALRAILAGEDETAPVIDSIPVPPLSEADALKQDVQELPDVATTDDYERVPISAFGAAMLRGMGWTEGVVAPKSDKRMKNGITELYLPQARPALLGIGAKEREPQDDGSGKKKPKGPDMRYIPVARRESERGENGSGRSGTVSRRGSRSPSRRERDDGTVNREKSACDDRERRKERDRDRDRDDGSRRRTRDYNERDRERKDHRDKDRARDQDVERDHARGRSDHYRDRGREGKEKEYGQRDHSKGRTRPDRREDR